MKKKLLITASTFPRWDNDTEPRFILDYAKEMTQYFEVHVLVPMAIGAKEEETLEGVTIHRFHYFPVHRLETLCYPGAIVPRIKERKIRILLVPFLLLALRRSVKKYSKKVDIVHAHWLIPQGIVQSTVKKIPFIVTGHGGDVTSLNMWPINILKRNALEKASFITAVSGALYDNIQAMYENDKTSIIPMGCDTKAFSPENKIENFFKQGDKKAILFVGRLAEKKGLTYLIEAMKKVDNAILYVVGKGDLEQQLKQQALEMGDRVVFLGAKTHQELPMIYASADLFVAPSITAADGDKEGFGLVIIEAMASGVPVVASKSGGIVDIISDRENGILCEEKNINELTSAINEIMNNEEMRAKLVANGLSTAKRNNYEAVGKKYYELLKEL